MSDKLSNNGIDKLQQTLANLFKELEEPANIDAKADFKLIKKDFELDDSMVEDIKEPDAGEFDNFEELEIGGDIDKELPDGDWLLSQLPDFGKLFSF